jgi:uncharacterized membrane protein
MKFLRRLFEGRKLEMWQDIAACLALHVLLILFILAGLLPALRATLSLLCLLFTPGYAALALFFPGKKDLDSATRFGLSPIVSVAVLIPIGLILNYSSWGLRLEAILAAVTGFVAVFGAAGLWRRSGLPAELQYQPPWPVSRRNAVQYLPLAAIVAVSFVAVWGYFEELIAENAGEPYTEFYLLGPDGTAGGYPQQAVAGEPVTILVGIANHERGPVLYHVVLVQADGSMQRIVSVNLDAGQIWEQPCTFTLTVPGEKNSTSFLLYREGDSEPYRSLQLWITVSAAPESTPGP